MQSGPLLVATGVAGVGFTITDVEIAIELHAFITVLTE